MEASQSQTTKSSETRRTSDTSARSCSLASASASRRPTSILAQSDNSPEVETLYCECACEYRCECDCDHERDRDRPCNYMQCTTCSDCPCPCPCPDSLNDPVALLDANRNACFYTPQSRNSLPLPTPGSTTRSLCTHSSPSPCSNSAKANSNQALSRPPPRYIPSDPCDPDADVEAAKPKQRTKTQRRIARAVVVVSFLLLAMSVALVAITLTLSQHIDEMVRRNIYGPDYSTTRMPRQNSSTAFGFLSR